MIIQVNYLVLCIAMYQTIHIFASQTKVLCIAIYSVMTNKVLTTKFVKTWQTWKTQNRRCEKVCSNTA